MTTRKRLLRLHREINDLAEHERKGEFVLQFLQEGGFWYWFISRCVRELEKKRKELLEKRAQLEKELQDVQD